MRSVEICWEEEVGASVVQVTTKERPSAMAMETLAAKPSGGRLLHQLTSAEGRPGGPRNTVMLPEGVGEVERERAGVVGGGGVDCGEAEEIREEEPVGRYRSSAVFTIFLRCFASKKNSGLKKLVRVHG